MTQMTFINHGFINAHNTEVDIAFTNTGTNDGIMAATGTGVLNVSFGDSLRSASFVNNGLIAIGPGSSGTITTAGSSFTDGFYGTLTNNALIGVDRGHLTLDTPWTQASRAATLVSQNGTLTVDSTSDGGTILIQSGMLDFEGFNGLDVAPAGVVGFNSELAFIGNTGSLHVSIPDLAISFKDATQELIIKGFDGSRTGITQVGDIHLTGGHYSLGNFSVDQTTDVISYHRS